MKHAIPVGANHDSPILDDLYQEVILDHNRRPRNYGKLDGANFYSHGYNPLSGDDYHLYLLIDESGKVKGVRFEGQGCAISKSSTSMMTEAIEGRSLKKAEQLKNSFLEVLTKADTAASQFPELGKLKIFEGVKKFPVRVKCATLAWHALEDALKDRNKEAT